MEELKCGCLLDKEKIVALCLKHEVMYYDKKFSNNIDEEVYWYDKLDEEYEDKS